MKEEVELGKVEKQRVHINTIIKPFTHSQTDISAHQPITKQPFYLANFSSEQIFLEAVHLNSLGKEEKSSVKKKTKTMILNEIITNYIH